MLCNKIKKYAGKYPTGFSNPCDLAISLIKKACAITINNETKTDTSGQVFKPKTIGARIPGFDIVPTDGKYHNAGILIAKASNTTSTKVNNPLSFNLLII
jgi:hypothetical protein